jgi:DNA repair exonuclease SbcCD ATPase subunit
LQEYKFANYNNNESVLRTNISNIQTLDLSYIPENKTEIFNSHIKKALMTFDLIEQVQKAESEYNLFAKNYNSLHFKVRKIQKKVLKIKKKIETLQADIRNLSNDKFSEKEKIEEEIKFLELEKEGLIDKIPQNWIEDNKKFQKIQKNKNITIKKYRRNTDDAYRELTQIKAFIGDAKQLEKLLKAITSLNSEINNENLNNAEKNIDSLIEQLNEISGVDELIEKLSEMNSMVTEDEIDKKKIASLNDKILTLFNEEIEWRNKASVSLFDKLNEYDDSIKNTIGLRLQERLTKKQAKFVSKCRSIHRDISLNF